MTRRAGSYARLSVYRDGSKSESTDRQHKDNAALATERDSEVVKKYTDKDTSAYHDVKRPDYDQALEDLANGEIDDLIAWDITRLTRQGLRGVSRILDALQQNPTGKLHLRNTPVDTSTPLGQAILGLFASVAEEESRSTSRRVTSYNLAAAEKGYAHSGGSRGFGYTRVVVKDGVLIEEMKQIPAEVELIKEMAERILKGDSRNEIAKSLNDRGYKTASGKPWTQSSVDMLLKQPRLYGMRQYKGKLFQGAWEPIFTAQEFANIQAALRSTMQQRRAQVEEHPPLLAKLIKCDLCGSTMSVTQTRVVKERKHYRRYACAGTNGQCGKTAILTEKADEEVIRAISAIKLPASRAPRSNPDAVLKQAEDRLSAWDDQFLHHGLDPAKWSDRRPKLVDEVEVARSQQTVKKAARGILAALEGGAEWWADASPAEKREAVGALKDIRCGPFENHSKGRLRMTVNHEAIAEAARQRLST